jgi:hypothetical protein
MGSIHEKTRGKKSRATVPLRDESRGYLDRTLKDGLLGLPDTFLKDG